jgi:hypothetical protein
MLTEAAANERPMPDSWLHEFHDVHVLKDSSIHLLPEVDFSDGAIYVGARVGDCVHLCNADRPAAHGQEAEVLASNSIAIANRYTGPLCCALCAV